MRKALQLAEQAFNEDEVPIGAMVVYNNEIIGKGYNQSDKLHDCTAHAEMLAITAASNYLQSKVLEGCSLFVTIQPCVMCAGAIISSRLKKVVYGAYEPKTGCTNYLTSNYLSKDVEWIGGVMEEESAALMKGFFKSKR